MEWSIWASFWRKHLSIFWVVEGRRIGKSDKWERIHIEFEYQSSNYKTHGHPIEGCDLIVCWDHDWKECPIEVLELKERIKDLGA